MPEVPRVRTTINVTVAAAALVAALRAAGEEPHRQEAELLLGQLWLETGRGAACDNHNVGNITSGSRWTGNFFRPVWYTVTPESSPHLQHLHEQMLAGKAPSAFRAYADFEHGFSDYVANLLHTFPGIVLGARSADAMAVSQAIRSSGYNPDNPVAPTAASLASLQREFEGAGVFAALPLAGALRDTQPPDSC